MQFSLRNEYPRPIRGTSILEVLAVLAVIFVLMMVILPQFARGCRRSARIVCVNNLKNIGLGLTTFATDYKDAYPWQVPEPLGGIAIPEPGVEASISNNLFAVFACISNELSTPTIVRCESDSRPRLEPNTWFNGFSLGSRSAQIPSYFLDTESYEYGPQSIIAGDRHLVIPAVGLDDSTPGNYNRITTIDRSNFNSTKSSAVRWNTNLHENLGNLLFGDGRVEQPRNKRQTLKFMKAAVPDATNSIHLLFPALPD